MPVVTRVVVCPFDLFGSSGSSNGARLLADAIREMLADNRLEKKKTRADAYTKHIRMRELPFATIDDYTNWHARACDLIRDSIAQNEFLIWISGNHLGALPIYEQLAAHDNRTPLVIQWDAHLDIYNLSDCTRELSHGNFLLHSHGPLPAIINVGARELVLRPEYIRKFYRTCISADQMARDNDAPIAILAKSARESDVIFLDIDCDVLDPAFFPAVSNPLPFGLTPQQLLRGIDAVWSNKIAGIAISEFDPSRDHNDRSLSLLLWLIEYLLLRKYE